MRTSSPVGADGDRSGPSAAGVLLAGLVPLLVLAPVLMRRRVIPQDEGQLLAYPSLLLEGLQPNTDFVYTYGIHNLWLLALSFEAFGESLFVERSLGLVVRMVLVLVVTDMVRRAGGRTAAVAAAWIATLFLAAEGLQAFAWISALTVACVAVWVAANLSTGRERLDEAVAWALGGLALGFRIDIALAVVPALLAVRWSRGLRPVGPAGAAGFTVGVLPAVVHLLSARNVLDDTIIDPVLGGGGRRLPLVPADTALRFSMLLVVVAVVVSCWVLIARRQQRGSEGYDNLLGLALVSLLTLPQLVQRVDATHVGYVAVVLVPSGIGAGSLWLRTRDPDRAPSRLGTVAIASLCALGAAGLLVGAGSEAKHLANLAAQVYSGDGEEVAARIDHGGRTVYVAPGEAADLESVLSELDALSSDSCDRLFVGPGDLRYAEYSDTFLYFLLEDLEPATRYLEFNPGGANARDSDLASELAGADLVVLNDAWDPAAESAEPGPRSPGEVLEAGFEPVARFGTWSVFASPRCSPAPPLLGD